MTSRYRQILGSIGGPSAISLRMWLWLSPLGVFGPFLSAAASVGPNGLLSLLFISTLSYFFGGAFLFIARIYWKREVSFSAPKPFLALLIFAVIGFASGLSFAQLFTITFPTIEFEYWQRVSARTVLGIFWSSTLAVLLDSRRRHTNALLELESQIRSTEDLLASRYVDAEDLRNEVRESVNKVLKKHFASGRASEMAKAADITSRNVSENVLREWIGRLPKKVPVLRPIELKPILNATLKRPPSPKALTLIVSLAFLLHAAAWGSAPGFVNAIQIGIVLFLTLTGVRVFKSKGTAPAIAFYAIGVLTSSYLANQIHVIMGANQFSLVNVVWGAWVLAGFLAVLLQLELERQDLEAALALQASQTHWHLEKITQQLRFESRRLSRILHGDIQAKLRAAAMSMKELSKDALDQLREECLAALDSDREAPTLTRFLRDSQKLWSDSVEINFECDRVLLKLIESDRSAASAVTELLREAILNATRHSDARTVKIRLHEEKSSGGHFVRVQVTNVGNLSKNSMPGMGSKLMQELASEWTLGQRGDEVEFMARVPCGQLKETSKTS